LFFETSAPLVSLSTKPIYIISLIFFRWGGWFSAVRECKKFASQPFVLSWRTLSTVFGWVKDVKQGVVAGNPICGGSRFMGSSEPATWAATLSAMACLKHRRCIFFGDVRVPNNLCIVLPDHFAAPPPLMKLHFFMF
jgi:hypothetical protein